MCGCRGLFWSPKVKPVISCTPTSLRVSARRSDVYLLEAAHEVVANWRSRQVSCARTPSNIEKVVRA